MFVKIELECLVPLDESLRQAFPDIEEATEEQVCALEEELVTLESTLQDRFGEGSTLKVLGYEAPKEVSEEKTIGDYL